MLVMAILDSCLEVAWLKGPQFSSKFSIQMQYIIV